MNLSNLITRTIAGAVYIALIVGSLLLGNVSFGLLCMIILIFSMDEYFKLIKRIKISTDALTSILMAAALMLILILYKNDLVGSNWLYLPPLLVLLTLMSQVFKKHRNPVQSVALTSFSYLYLLLPMACLYMLGFYSGSWSNQFNYEVVLGLFILNWASDTGAYLVGSAIGKTKLLERISPKKTIEGSLGGLVVTVGIAFLLSTYFHQVTTLDWIVIALIVVFFGTSGDLFESLLKRKAEVKDSGKLIPGHGGMLDRFDSIYFSAPAVFVYLGLISS